MTDPFEFLPLEIPNAIKALARPVLCHRVLPSFHAESEGITAPKLIDQLLTIVKS